MLCTGMSDRRGSIREHREMIIEYDFSHRLVEYRPEAMMAPSVSLPLRVVLSSYLLQKVYLLKSSVKH